MRHMRHPLYWLAVVPLAMAGTPLVMWLNATERYIAALIATGVQVVLLIVQLVALSLWIRYLHHY